MKTASSLLSPLGVPSNLLVPDILVVDDDPALGNLLVQLYERSGYNAVSVRSGEEALALMEQRNIDFVIADLKLPVMSGTELIARVKEKYTDVPFLAITGCRDVDLAISAFKNGACDFVIKPIDFARLLESTRVALQTTAVHMEMRHLRRYSKDGYRFGPMISKTPEMNRIFEIVRSVAPTDMTISVEGETGTGKELLADAVHNHSGRRDNAFVKINCAGFPESLLEAELFGYEKGAFTGAVQSNPGKIELAHGGTLFLDEIESMSLTMQGKLLRILEDRYVERLGGHSGVHVDIRVIAATNVPLRELVAAGKMRRDFYYRINVVPIHLIPLRQRRVDIPLLVQNFLGRHPVAKQKGIRSISNEALRRLLVYPWPGNIRELQNFLERAIVLNVGETIHHVDLPVGPEENPDSGSDCNVRVPLKQWLVEKEKQYLARKLNDLDGNVGLTARNCRISLRTLTRKMHRYGLDKAVFKKSALSASRRAAFSAPVPRPTGPKSASA